MLNMLCVYISNWFITFSFLQFFVSSVIFKCVWGVDDDEDNEVHINNDDDYLL